MRPTATTRSGVALIITLAFIVLVTILVVGLNGLMSVERPAANSHFEKTRASQYAQKGVEQVVAKLDQDISDPSLYWISQPGQLTVSDPPVNGGRAFGAPRKPVKLSSGFPTISLPASSPALPAYLLAPDLNLTTLQDPGKHLITERRDPGTGLPLKLSVRWIYLRQNGVADLDEAPAFSSSNPITGRYAYWTDDESCKINCNLAWGRATNLAPVSSATRLELTAFQDPSDSAADLTLPVANAIHAFITKDAYKTLNFGFFNSPKDARRVPVNGQTGGAAAAPLEKYKFEVTHYNHDPDITFFNEPRIVLTTRPDRAGWTWELNPDAPSGTKQMAWIGKNKHDGDHGGLPHYIRILKDEGTPAIFPDSATLPAKNGAQDPGLAGDGTVGTLDTARVSDTLNFLVSYLKRSDWPMVDAGSTSSFQTKYFSNYPAAANSTLRLVQLALNIVDYVRSAESPLPIVLPLRANIVAVGSPPASLLTFTLGAPPAGTGQSSNSFIGSARMPFMTEVGYWFEPKSTGKWQRHFLTEIHSPAHYNIPPFNVTDLILGLDTQEYGTNTITRANVLAADLAGPTQLSPGGYVTVDHKIDAAPAGYAPLSVIHSRMYLGTSANLGAITGLVDIAPLAIDSNADFIPVNVDKNPPAKRESIVSFEVDDPRVNAHRDTWVPSSHGDRIQQPDAHNFW